MTSPPRLTLEQLATLEPPWSNLLAPVADGAQLEPLVVVELEDIGAAGAAALRRCADAVRSSLAITVGILPDGAGVEAGPAHELLDALDLTLGGRDAPKTREVVAVAEPDAALAEIAAAVAASPHAALALASLARQTPHLGVREALVAESATYSLLLGGPELARWLERRGPPREAPRGDEAPRVRLARSGDALDVVLTRPHRRNAVDARMRDELFEALTLPLLDSTIATVRISGEGSCFSAGGDLDEFGSAENLALAHVVRLVRSVGWLVHRVRARTSVHLHGPCRGAGVELAAFAGRVTADPGTTVGLPELGLGLVPGAGGTVSVPRRIGRWRFAWLALGGRAIDAEAALDWGLVDELRG